MADRVPFRPKGDAGDGPKDEPDEDDEELDETVYKTVKDAVLFAIEVNASMLQSPSPSGASSRKDKDDQTSPLVAALKCAHHMMQQRIISAPKDLMGILLYGTEASKFYDESEDSRGGWSFPHCYLLTELDVPEAEDVRYLRDLTDGESPDAAAIFRPAREPVSMANVLFCANQIFQTKAANFTSRRLFIVTDNDNPHAANKSSRSQATVRAKDLYDLGVVIELFPISSAGHMFDTTRFYDDIIYTSSPADTDAVLAHAATGGAGGPPNLVAGSPDGISLLHALLSTIAAQIVPKRALFSAVPLEMAPDLRISVKGYLLYKHQRPARSCYVYLGAEKPQIVTGTTEQVAFEEEKVIAKTEVRKAYTFGGERVTFSEAEAKTLREWGDPVIRVLGFKPLSTLPLWANVKNSTFLYPSEEDYVGSTRVYSALYRKLARDRLYALTWFVPRRNATPVMAAMVPTTSATEDDQSPPPPEHSPSGAPQGLHLIPLPFADDIRQNPPSATATGYPLRAPDDLVDAMRPIIQQLNLPKGVYDPSKYPNPSLQWHYRILQAIALDDEVPTHPEDKTVPKYRQIDKRVGQEAIQWGKVLEQTFKQHQSEHLGGGGGSKRGTDREAAPSSAAHKRLKTESGEGMSEEELRRYWSAGQLPTLTLVQLKDFCALKKIAVSGKKADIVERIEAWLESK